MRLADLVDLEAQLARDAAAASPQVAAARDARIAAEGRLPGEAPHQALRGWLEALRAESPAQLHPGERVEAALRWARLLLVLCGLALGWGALTGLVEVSRPHPVNVWSFLLAFVLLQLLLFLSTAAGAAALARPGRATSPGPVHELLGGLVQRLAGRAFRDGARLEAWRALGRRLQARRHLYGRLETWQLLALGQAFGVAFNVAAALALLRLVTFTDVAFSWSTTLGALNPARFHAIVSRLAWPWGWAVPDAVPSREVVEATRYWHLEGRYDGAGLAPALRGAWWPFLLASLLTYGLLPRLAMLLLAGWRRRVELARLPDGADVDDVLRRLGAARPIAPATGAPGGAAGARAVGGWLVVRWREAALDAGIAAALAARLEGPAAPGGAWPVVEAGGPTWVEGGAAAALGASGVRPAGLAFLAEAHQPADAATLRFLAEARAWLGPKARLRVILGEPAAGTLVAPAPAQLAAWRDRLTRLGDAFLGLEGIAEGPAATPRAGGSA